MKKLLLLTVALTLTGFFATPGPAVAENNANIFDNPILLAADFSIGFGVGGVLPNHIAGNTSQGKANSAGLGIGFGSGTAVTVVNCVATKCDGAQFMKGTAVRGGLGALGGLAAANIHGKSSEILGGLVGGGTAIVAEGVMALLD